MSLRETILSVLGQDRLKHVVNESGIRDVDRRSSELMRKALLACENPSDQELLEFLTDDEYETICDNLGLTADERARDPIDTLIHQSMRQPKRYFGELTPPWSELAKMSFAHSEPQTWRNIRVFISSTFLDMQAERDHLVKIVFPKLREKLKRHRVRVVDVDLRWGITEHEAEQNGALDVCLARVDECRPFFVGILGERYGYIPTRFSEDVVTQHPWLLNNVGKSITELEILYAWLKDQSAGDCQTFFYFRDPRVLSEIPEHAKSSYLETKPDRVEYLRQLKERVREKELRLFESYPATWDADAGQLSNLHEFGQRVFNDLWGAIRERLGLCDVDDSESDADRFQQEVDENDLHERLMEVHHNVSSGRSDAAGRLDAFLHSDTESCMVVTGRIGCGKTSVLSCFVASTRKQKPDVLVIPHFVGSSPNSTLQSSLLKRINKLLGYRLNLNFEIVGDELLVDTVGGLISRIPDEVEVLLVIDGVDQMDGSDQPHEMPWLPVKLPKGVKVVCSCRSDEDTGRPALRIFHKTTGQRCESLICPLRIDNRLLSKFPLCLRKGSAETS